MGRFAKGCTGTFISSYVVLTAAHCIYYYRYKYGLDIYRKKHCDPHFGVKHSWTTAIFYKNWKDTMNTGYDIAWIIYDSPSPAYMPYTSNTPPVGTEISIYGYPESKTLHCLWGSSKPLMKIEPLQLLYQVDTSGGQSGSVIFYYDGGNPVIIGVHAYYMGSYNMGTRLVDEYAKVCNEIISFK
jgi:glutamyl endopeptidase